MATTLIKNNYKYFVELLYTDETTYTATKLRTEQIKSVMIDRDYDKNNMPLIFVTLAIDKKLIDKLVSNYKNSNMILRLYKFAADSDIQIKEKFLEVRCTYFINEDLNYNYELDYPDGQEEEVNKEIIIGLMSVDITNANKAISIGSVLSGNTFDIVRFYTSKLNMIIEPFNYNKTLTQQIVKEVNSITQLLRYLNSISVFYKTSYRFFMDFDRSYLVSSANKEIPATGETISAVLICVKDALSNIENEEGMYINNSQKNYQINIPTINTSVYKSQSLEKLYTELNGTTTLGDTSNSTLSVNKSKSSSEKTELVRVENNNSNMVQNMSSDIGSSSVLFTMEKNGIDSSVMNINKRYIIKNYDGHSDIDGDFLLSRKVEYYIREDNNFTMNTMLTFRIKP